LTAHNNSYSRKDTRTAAEKGKQCKFVGGCLYIQKPEHCSHYLTRWPKDGMRGGGSGIRWSRHPLWAEGYRFHQQYSTECSLCERVADVCDAMKAKWYSTKPISI